MQGGSSKKRRVRDLSVYQQKCAMRPVVKGLVAGPAEMQLIVMNHKLGISVSQTVAELSYMTTGAGY